MQQRDLDAWHMARAVELAARGEGRVEPNPMVGCIIARGAEIIGQGWHRQFGGPHAEVEALAVAAARAAGATLYATLEPCCHHGKTPPCTEAILAAGIRRVVVAQRDPFPAVAGRGLAQLEQAGVEIETGVLEAQAQRLNAPYLKLLRSGSPWVIVKWAMTLDGKIASRTGDSRWISNEVSRQIVHHLRGRVDAILVGRGTALKDDPLLTARPAGPRTATRVVLDTQASLPLSSQLVRTAAEWPVLMAVGPQAAAAKCDSLVSAGCEIFVCDGETPAARLHKLLAELGRRRMTNVLVEGGSQLLGALADARLIDEVHAFIAPTLLGGGEATSPVGGIGLARMSESLRMVEATWESVEGDLYFRGRVDRSASG